MRTIINDIEVKNYEDLEKAMEWHNQKGEYAKLVQIAENNGDWVEIKGMTPYYQEEYDEKGLWSSHVVGGYCTIRNWYNENKECLTPYNDGYAYSKELSLKYNIKEMAKYIGISK